MDLGWDRMRGSRISCGAFPKDRATVLVRLPKDLKRRLQVQAKEQGVWRIFAETRISENFLEHLKFKKQETFVYTRTNDESI